MQPNYWRTIGILLTLLLAFGASEAKKYKFKDDNYSIKLDKSWKLNQSYSTGFAQLFYSDTLKQSLIIRKLPALILEDSKLPSNKKEFVTFLKNNYLKGQMNKILTMMKTHFSIKPVTIANKYDSFLVNLMGNTKNTPITTSISIISINKNTGYLFTLINVGHREVTPSDIEHITKNFKLLKSNPKPKDIKLVAQSQSFKSPYYGYQVPYFNGMITTTNAQLGLAADEAIFNHIQIDVNSGSVFMVASYCNSQINLSEETLLSFLTEEQEDVLEPFTIKKDDNNQTYASGKLIDKDVEQLVYYYKVLKFNDCNHITIYFDTVDHGLKPLNQFIKHIKPYKRDKSLVSTELLQKNNIIHATFQASLGQFLENKGDINSLPLLKKAVELNPKEQIFLENYLTACNNHEKYKDGLKMINSLADDASTAQIQSWKAWFLAKSEQINQAIAVYKKIFAKDYTNDEDFFSYLYLLESKNMWEPLLTTISANKDKVSKQKSLQVKLAMAYAKSGNKEKAKEILSDISRSKDFDDYDIYKVLDVYFELKDFEKGIELITDHIDKQTKDINSYYYLGDFQYNAGKPKLALDSMQKALAFDPKNETILNYIAGINSQSGIGDINIVKTPIDAIELPKQIQKDIKKQTLKNLSRPISNYYYITGYDFQIGQVFTKTYYRKYRINDLQSAEESKTLQIKFNQEYEHPYINKFSVRNLKTNETTQLQIDTVYITSINDGISADGDKYLNIPIPSIADNTEIEYVISIQSHAKVDTFNLETDYFVSVYPYLYMASFVQGDVKRITSKYTNKISFSQHKKLKIWKSNEIDLYKQEANRPEFHKTFQWVEIASTEKSWKQAGNDYLSKIEDKLHSELSKGQLLSILPDSRDSITITKELAKFVQSGVTYQALEFGSRALIPNTTKQTLQNKYGDCKDHAVILYDLLKKKGIKAYLALVNTKEYINPDLVTLDQFDHMIVYVPKINGGVFIDATDKYTAIDLQIPPRSVQGSKALILEKNKSRLVDIPQISAEQNNLSIERTVSKENNLFISKETAIAKGYIASEIRAFLQPLTKEHINTDISQWVNGYYPNLTVLDFNYYNLEKLDKPLIIEFTFQQNSHNTDFKVPAFLERVYLSYSAYQKRLYPFRIIESFAITSKTTTNDPQLQVNKQSSRYKSAPLNWSFASNKNTQSFTSTLNSGVYKAENYQKFFDSLKKAIYTVEKSIILKP